jgi:hypothetical protein
MTKLAPVTTTKTYVHLDLEEFLEDFGLRRIFECGNLRKILLEGVAPNKHRDGDLENPLQTLWELAYWMKEGFETRSQKVEIRVCTRRGFWGHKDQVEAVL